ncbi:MAG: type II secretion system protein GspG [Pseudomonadales bacterium]
MLNQLAIISTLVVLLATPSTLLAAERSMMDEVWSWICGMVDVWEVACEFQRVETALQDYEKETGRTLSPGAGLDTLVEQGYLDSNDIEDPWGNTYRYRVSLDGRGGYLAYLSSAGPDGVHGTDDDLGN